MTGTNITLELSPRLQQEQIVTSYIFDLNGCDIVLELNHIYDKKIIVSPIEINDWQYTIQSFKDVMEDQNIDRDHITMICDVADKKVDHVMLLSHSYMKSVKDIQEHQTPCVQVPYQIRY